MEASCQTGKRCEVGHLLLEMSVGDGFCPKEKAPKASWMKTGQEVNIKIQRINKHQIQGTRASVVGSKETRSSLKERRKSEDVSSGCRLGLLPFCRMRGICAGFLCFLAPPRLPSTARAVGKIERVLPNSRR